MCFWVELYKVKSNDEIAAILKSHLMGVTAQKSRKIHKPKHGISKYLSEDTSSEDEDEFDNNDDFNQLDKTIMNNDKEQLIDLELVNLLKYCNDLYDKYKHNNEGYSEEIMLKSIELGKKTKQKLLILDMDETMISARFKAKMPQGFKTDFIIDFQGNDIHVRIRPYLLDCLERLSKLYEIVVFTAGVQEYADKILDHIDSEKALFKKRLYRQDCIDVNGEFLVKDLDIFIDRDKENMIIVDNSILSFAFDLDNGVPIQSFLGTEEEDKELLFLISFLEETFYQEDVRKQISESFKLTFLKNQIVSQW